MREPDAVDEPSAFASALPRAIEPKAPLPLPRSEKPERPLPASRRAQQEEEDESDGGWLRKPDAGTLALLLGGLAIAASSFASYEYLTKPLAGGGVLLGLGALLAGFLRGRVRRLGVAIIGTVLCLVVLILMGTWPDLGPERTILEAAPLQRDGVTGNRALKPDEWVDADKHAVILNGIRVQVLGVRVGKAEFRDGAAPAPGPDRSLILELNVGTTGERFPYESWAFGKHAPMLSDNAENKYAQITLQPMWTMVGRTDRDYVVFVPPLKEVLVFGVPPANTPYLRLLLPASAFGLKGEFRFQIPASMIKNLQ